VSPFSGHEPHATRTKDEEFLARYAYAQCERVRLLRRLGVPPEDIVTTARDASIDLIVLAWNQNLGPGRVVSETLAHSSIAVLLLPVFST
jgi:hypothetical protein